MDGYCLPLSATFKLESVQSQCLILVISRSEKKTSTTNPSQNFSGTRNHGPCVPGFDGLLAAKLLSDAFEDQHDSNHLWVTKINQFRARIWSISPQNQLKYYTRVIYSTSPTILVPLTDQICSEWLSWQEIWPISGIFKQTFRNALKGELHTINSTFTSILGLKGLNMRNWYIWPKRFESYIS